MKAKSFHCTTGGNLQDYIEALERRRQAAMRLLKDDTAYKAESILSLIEKLDPTTKLSSSKKRQLEAYLNKVSQWYAVDLRDPAILRS